MANLNVMKKKDLLKELSKHYQSEDELNRLLKNKPTRLELIQLIKQKGCQTLGGDTIIFDINKAAEAPKITDPDWTEYVISLLTEKEKTKGYPTVNGLRRVTQIVKGAIVHITTDVLQCPTAENGLRSVVVVTVGFCDKSSFDGAAETNQQNTPDMTFRKHSVATAEGRAEGRALRKALCLNTLTAEEMGPSVANIPDDNEPITSGQRQSIIVFAGKLDTTVDDALVDFGIGKVLNDFTYKDASDMINYLRKKVG